MTKKILLYALFVTLTIPVKGRESSDSLSFLQPAPDFHSKRFWGLNAGLTAGYTGTLLLLNEYWYKGYERSSFHFFDDSREWMQMDKAGHLFTSYLLTDWSTRLYRWSGLSNSNSAWAGGIAASVLMTSIEVLDGFSEKWGASYSDLMVNAGGASIFVTQELLWKEQRLRVKFSAWPQSYDPDVIPRVIDLYGHTAAEWLLKDYNAFTLWLSVNPSSFAPDVNWLPEWLNLAVGYGANGMLGGYNNRWCAISGYEGNCPKEHIVDRADIPRYRQYYLSLDADLSRINTRSRFLETLLYMLNIIKIPAPVLEYNRIEGMKFHWMHF